MSEVENPVIVETVACDICIKEIPKSEVTIDEARDYVLYFFGLDCYEKWQDEKEKSK